MKGNMKRDFTSLSFTIFQKLVASNPDNNPQSEKGRNYNLKKGTQPMDLVTASFSDIVEQHFMCALSYTYLQVCIIGPPFFLLSCGKIRKLA